MGAVTSLLRNLINITGLPQWLSGKESACNAGDPAEEVSIPVSERSPGGRHGYPLQYSCLGNAMDRGAWQAIVHEVARVGNDLETNPSPSPSVISSRILVSSTNKKSLAVTLNSP